MSIPRWVEQAEKELWDEYENGSMSVQQYNRELRGIYEELQYKAEEEAHNVFDDIIGRY